MIRLGPFLETSVQEILISSNTFSKILEVILKGNGKNYLISENLVFGGNSRVKILIKGMIKYLPIGCVMTQSCFSNLSPLITENIDLYKKTRPISETGEKIILISGLDRLQSNQQMSFRKTLEKNCNSALTIVLVTKLENLEKPIFSRCNFFDLQSFSFLQFYSRIFDSNNFEKFAKNLLNMDKFLSLIYFQGFKVPFLIYSGFKTLFSFTKINFSEIKSFSSFGERNFLFSSENPTTFFLKSSKAKIGPIGYELKSSGIKGSFHYVPWICCN
mmetsp:Transcript_61/g.86  ORF Transcript_61/g.86 Transcript_61/m.86 type:complete len:273 (-) Transcript_61:1011-1829(-)